MEKPLKGDVCPFSMIGVLSTKIGAVCMATYKNSHYIAEKKKKKKNYALKF